MDVVNKYTIEGNNNGFPDMNMYDMLNEGACFAIHIDDGIEDYSSENGVGTENFQLVVVEKVAHQVGHE